MDKERMQRLKQNPRSGFIRAIREKDIPGCLVRTAEIHGHFCPGCGDAVMATKTATRDTGERYCLPCSGSGIRQVDGRGVGLAE